MPINRTLLTKEIFEKKYQESWEELELSKYIIIDSSFFNPVARKFSRLTFINCEFKKNFEIKERFFANRLVFRDCVFEEDVNFYEIALINTQISARQLWQEPCFHFCKCEVKGLFGLSGRIDGMVRIEGSELGAVALTIGQVDILSFEKCEIAQLSIPQMKAIKRAIISNNTIGDFRTDFIECADVLIADNRCI